MNLATEHIRNNLNLFGFGTQKTAVLQAIKELLENAIDACKVAAKTVPSADGLHKIAVTISARSNNPDFITVEVSDDGIGMADPYSFLSCFSTTKSDGSAFVVEDCMTGKFGIGLSACLTYVLLTSGAPMRLVTKCPNSSVGFVADFVLDSDGNPAAQAQAQTNVSTDRHVSGTTIRMQLLVSEWPMNTERGRQLMDDVLSSLTLYLNRLQLLPSASLTISLFGSLDGWQSNQEFISSRLASPVSLMTELNYKSTLRGNLNRHVIRSMQLLCNHSASSIARTSHGNESLCITASANLCLPIYREDTQQQPFLVSNERIAVHIMRFVNGVPLLEKGDDAMSCLITRVVRSLNWANYGGYRMRLIPDEDLVRIYHPTQSRSNTDSLLVAPVWELQYTRGGGEISVAAPSAPKDVSDDSTSAMEEDVDRLIIEGPEAVDNGSGVAVNRRAVVSTEEDAETRRFASLVLTVDVCGHKIPYTDMRKTCLGQDGETLRLTIASALQNALLQMQAEDKESIDQHKFFVSKKDAQKDLVKKMLIPSCARSLAAIIGFAEESDRMRYLQALEFVTDSDGRSESLLQAKIVHTLRAAHDRMQSSSSAATEPAATPNADEPPKRRGRGRKPRNPTMP